jgi:hypothetical protein
MAVSVKSDSADVPTQVALDSDIQVSGKAAQISRGMIPEVSRQVTEQFAECLRTSIAAAAPLAANPEEHDSVTAIPAPPGQPKIGGLRLGAVAIWRMFTRKIRRIFHPAG